MGWELILIAFIGSLLIFMSLGIPVAFALLIVNFLFTAIFIGPAAGFPVIIRSMLDTVGSYLLLAIPFFILLGELLFHSGLALKTLNSVSKWMGNIPGRLCMVAVASGTFLGALSGSAMAATATLGSLLAPDMTRLGYSKRLTVGSILGGGGMSMIIPPSSVAILVGTIGGISISKLLIGGVVPGLILAAFIMIYIGIRSLLRKSEAPSGEIESVSWRDRLMDLAVNILPVTILMALVLSSIFFGIATPNEASALSVIGVLVLILLYKKLNWKIFKASCLGMVRTTGMIFMIMAGAAAFSQLLAFTGASRQLVQSVTNLPLPPTVILLFMILIVIFLGCFFDPNSILMITLPLYMPLIHEFGIHPVLFGLIMLVNMDIANLTPPFGLALFVAKGVLPESFSMADVYMGALPIVLIEILVVAMMVAFPAVFTWLPDLM